MFQNNGPSRGTNAYSGKSSSQTLPAIPMTIKRLTTILTLVSLLFSCDNMKELKPEVLAIQACDCFVQQPAGTIDEKLDPCLSKPINDNIGKIHEFYDKDKPAEVAIKNYMTEVTIRMIKGCDKFYNEMDVMYTNFYPELTKELVLGQILQIQDSLIDENLSDSLKIALLHKRIALLTRARDFENAIVDIETLVNKYGRKDDTYWVTAYILRAQGKYQEAINELDKAIEAGNPDYIVIKELVKRKNDR